MSDSTDGPLSSSSLDKSEYIITIFPLGFSTFSMLAQSLTCQLNRGRYHSSLSVVNSKTQIILPNRSSRNPWRIDHHIVILNGYFLYSCHLLELIRVIDIELQRLHLPHPHFSCVDVHRLDCVLIDVDSYNPAFFVLFGKEKA